MGSCLVLGIFFLMGIVVLVVGVGVFVVCLFYVGLYVMFYGGLLYVGLVVLVLGGILLLGRLWVLVWFVLVVSFVIFFLVIYLIVGELEEVIFFFVVDVEDNFIDLWFWIVDCEDGVWVGMFKDKVVEYSLDGF